MGNEKRERRKSFPLIRLGLRPIHLKVNCPKGAREASLDCPPEGKAFNHPFLSHTKTGDSFAAVSGFVFYLAGLGSVSSCRPNRAAMAPICSRLKGRAKPAGFSI